MRGWGGVQGVLGTTSSMESWASLEEAVSMLIVTFVGVTSLERQSAALFFALEIHSKEMLYVASSRLYLLTLLLVFFPLRKYASGLWSF